MTQRLWPFFFCNLERFCKAESSHRQTGASGDISRSKSLYSSCAVSNTQAPTLRDSTLSRKVTSYSEPIWGVKMRPRIAHHQVAISSGNPTRLHLALTGDPRILASANKWCPFLSLSASARPGQAAIKVAYMRSGLADSVARL